MPPQPGRVAWPSPGTCQAFLTNPQVFPPKVPRSSLSQHISPQWRAQQLSCGTPVMDGGQGHFSQPT